MIPDLARGSIAAALILAVLGLGACAGNTLSSSPAPQVPMRTASFGRTQGSPATSCPPRACIYVTNQGTNTVTVYAAGANGNAAPKSAGPIGNELMTATRGSIVCGSFNVRGTAAGPYPGKFQASGKWTSGFSLPDDVSPDGVKHLKSFSESFTITSHERQSRVRSYGTAWVY
jgi:hypothetical protein